MIHADTLIEDILLECPEAIRYLMENNIKCIACGEPVWETLEEAARAKGFTPGKIKMFVSDINALDCSNNGIETRSQ